MKRWFYSAGTAVLKPFFAVLWPSKVTGVENIPDEGGAVVCINHCHWLDPVYLAARARKRKYVFLAKAEVFKKPVFKWFLGDVLGAIPINRGQADITAIRESMKVIADGGCLGIFPQGTRSKDNSPTPMLNGVSMIAVRANAPIIPVYIGGPYRLFRPVDVRIGKPVEIADLGRKFDSETLTTITKRIETAIWSMADK